MITTKSIGNSSDFGPTTTNGSLSITIAQAPALSDRPNSGSGGNAVERLIGEDTIFTDYVVRVQQ